MIKIENTEVMGWEHAIRGMRNPMNSWAKSDSEIINRTLKEEEVCPGVTAMVSVPCMPYTSVGPNDHELMMKLAKGGPVHAKYRRMITVYMDITAPLYWWKEFDTYKVGTVANSCSTMHKIHEKEFTLEDFSCEKLALPVAVHLRRNIEILNVYRDLYVNWDKKDDNSKNALLTGIDGEFEYDKKDAWWQMIQLLPSSYNQKRTIMLNYEVLAGIYESRKNHKLDEWREFCKWIEGLPYSEIITGGSETVEIFADGKLIHKIEVTEC